jgi:hypothetical protein
LDLRGTWNWTCCAGRHRGTFQIASQNADGSFSGQFGNGPDDGRSPIAGRLTGAAVAFTRTIVTVKKDQTWQGSVTAGSGGALAMKGTWGGYGYLAGASDFSAQKAAGAADPPGSYPASVAGRWSWTCCKATVSGTWTLSQDSQGKVKGTFGNGPGEGASPFEGTYADGVLTFARTLTGSLAGRQQSWRGTVQRSGSSWRIQSGSWSGYGAAPGYTDFQATYLGAR